MESMLRDLWIDQIVILELYHKFIDPVCEKHNLNRVEFGILLFLAKYPHLNRAADIVKYKGLSKSYVSLSVKELSERGLLEGKKTAQDRKNIYITLLPACDEIIKDGLAAQHDFCAVLCKGLTPEEASVLFAYSHKTVANVKKALEEPKQPKTKRTKKA
jgi:DNA-binding MarR family transcriptional regulator